MVSEEKGQLNEGDIKVRNKLCQLWQPLTVVVWGLLASACSTVEGTRNSQQIAEAPIAYHLFAQPEQALISERELFQLTPAQEHEFLAHFERVSLQGKQPNEVLSEYLTYRLPNFNYYGDTYIATQAMSLNQGNCMSLAILTTALAKVVGIEFGYREVHTMPIFEQKNNLLLSSSHVQTKLFDASLSNLAKSVAKNSSSQVALRSGIIVDYFPSKTNLKSRFISYAQFVAMFYRNIASDALVDNELNLAFAYAVKAYEMDKTSPQILNLLAVLHRRAGDEESAESIYQLARAYDNNSVTVLSNYIVLLEKQGRQAEASEYREQMETLEDPNPYIWLEQAYLAQNQDDHSGAISYFHKVIKLAPYVHQAYIGLYQSYMKKSKPILASKALEAGIEWAYAPKERKQFKYKLYGLRAKYRNID